ncbi:helix-turn-helix transcriptional regulator [Massilia aerilata]|uniref:Response regulator transcription factor n=1 Tax=Massilia aerilata TaxID=453817 RepID=A0ABW0RVX8_9BURK
MHPVSRALLKLYDDCLTLAIDQFQVAIFDHLQSMVRFDTARLIGVDMAGGSATVRSSILFREPESMPLHWEEISKLDTVLSTVASTPGRACNYNARQRYSAPKVAIVLDYTTRFRHMNGLVVATTNGVPGYLEGLSLYRARDEQPFKPADESIIESFAPHIQQALQINRALAQRCEEQAAPFAIVSAAGAFNFCSPRLFEMLCTEFPGWRGPLVPALVRHRLATGSAYAMSTLPVELRLRRFGSVWLMTALPLASSGLTLREAAVAKLFAQGKSHKEVARSLNLAPATVRNFLQRIYQKLDVHDKASLAVRLMAREA